MRRWARPWRGRAGGGARRGGRRAPRLGRGGVSGGGETPVLVGLALGRGRGWSLCRLLGRFELEPAGDGVLELTHPAAERAAHLGNPLGTEDEEQDGEEDEKLGDADEAGHVGLLSVGARPAGRTRRPRLSLRGSGGRSGS